MNNIFSTYFKIITLISLLFVCQVHLIYAQEAASETSYSIMFGGTKVKIDEGARKQILEIIKILKSNKKSWNERRDQAALFFPIVENILEKEQVPVDFKYLALKQSGLKPDIVSSFDAIGYWQLSAKTAQKLDLRVDKQIDERKNISSSTYAAAWYLKRNNPQASNWVSALYAYYQSKVGVKKTVRHSLFDAT